MPRRLLSVLTLLALSLPMPALAVEGMFTPDQLPSLKKDLRKAGLKLKPENLTDLTAFPMGAVISLGNCTASFVSKEGLAVTNHHCARGSVQFNSTEEDNYLETGFIAKTKSEELPAAPGSRIYVTTKVLDVTAEVLDMLPDGMPGKARYDAIDATEKLLIKNCEKTPGRRCQVARFFGGLQYKLIERLEIQDVRLVYAPGDSIGKYGGDIDNWLWPRHTGDFAFYRAYVGPDGTPAPYSENNVPFTPEHVLKVSAAGLEDGDFVMAAGYPGSTSRYARLGEVKNTFDWFYPTYVELIDGWVKTIEAAAPQGTDARIKYESLLAGLNNALKNFGGQIDGALRVGLVDRRAARDATLNDWVKDRPEAQKAIAAVDALEAESAIAERKAYWYRNATRPALLRAAQQLYRLAKEQEKPDNARERGYQERDLPFIQQGLEALERRYDPVVDEAIWKYFLARYQTAPDSERMPAFEDALSLSSDTDIAALTAPYYAETYLSDKDQRIALMRAKPETLEALDDPFIKLAVALYDTEIALENAEKDRAGRSSAIRPGYMQAIIDWQEADGKVTYPDANSTLRVTYGSVLGGSPADGVIYEPFTRLEGISAKHRGKDPFDAPERQRTLIAAKDYGPYLLKDIGSVPVNFLSDLDSTGGNSGSATMDATGALVGLLFDGTIESVNSDWDFDPRTTRTIHVDTRYMLWVMEKVDDAGHLIDEMDIVR